jgi:hypothetical protein
MLSCLAVFIGAISALTAYVLVWLINLIANLSFYQRLRHNIGRLPVVSRADPKELAGYLGRSSVMAARRLERGLVPRAT